MSRAKGIHAEILTGLTFLMAVALLLSGLLIVRYFETRHVDNMVNEARKSLPLVIQEWETAGAVHTRLHNYFGSELLEINLFRIGQGRDEGLKKNPVLRRVAYSGRGELSIHYRSAANIASDGSSIATIVEPLHRGKNVIGSIEIVLSLESLRKENQNALVYMLFFVVLYGFVLVLYGRYVFSKKIVRPIVELNQATKKIADGDFTANVAVDGPFEIEGLGGSFNLMVEELAEKQVRLESVIDELNQKNRRLTDTQKELVQAEKLASVGNLAAGMAHEIGNPLGAIVGYVDLLKSEVESNDGEQLIAYLTSEIERIDRLLRDLLHYARRESLDIAQFDYRESIEGAITILENQGKLSRSFIDTDLEPAIVEVSKSMLTQVFVNLFLNSGEAVSTAPEVMIEGSLHAETLHILYSDNGPGVPETIVADIFDPFVTSKDKGRARGLGLSVCCNVVADAGGTLEYVLNEGGGACFHIELPVVRDCRSDDD